MHIALKMENVVATNPVGDSKK